MRSSTRRKSHQPNTFQACVLAFFSRRRIPLTDQNETPKNVHFGKKNKTRARTDVTFFLFPKFAFRPSLFQVLNCCSLLRAKLLQRCNVRRCTAAFANLLAGAFLMRRQSSSCAASSRKLARDVAHGAFVSWTSSCFIRICRTTECRRVSMTRWPRPCGPPIVRTGPCPVRLLSESFGSTNLHLELTLWNLLWGPLATHK